MPKIKEWKDRNKTPKYCKTNIYSLEKLYRDKVLIMRHVEV